MVKILFTNLVPSPGSPGDSTSPGFVAIVRRFLLALLLFYLYRLLSLVNISKNSFSVSLSLPPSPPKRVQRYTFSTFISKCFSCFLRKIFRKKSKQFDVQLFKYHQIHHQRQRQATNKINDGQSRGRAGQVFSRGGHGHRWPLGG